jgi:spore germination protein GerM
MRPRLAIAGIAVCGLVVGCSVPSQDSPTIIEPTSVPFGLLDQGRTEPAPPVAADTGEAATVYFVNSKALVGVRRDMHEGSTRRRLVTVVADLASGPTTTEQARGLATAVPPGLRLKVVSVVDSQATIDLSGQSVGGTAAESPLTIAQIVLSVTSLSGVDEVQLTRDHQRFEAPLADGSLTTAPLRADDYQDLRRGGTRTPQ